MADEEAVVRILIEDAGESASSLASWLTEGAAPSTQAQDLAKRQSERERLKRDAYEARLLSDAEFREREEVRQRKKREIEEEKRLRQEEKGLREEERQRKRKQREEDRQDRDETRRLDWLLSAHRGQRTGIPEVIGSAVGAALVAFSASKQKAGGDQSSSIVPTRRDSRGGTESTATTAQASVVSTSNLNRPEESLSALKGIGSTLQEIKGILSGFGSIVGVAAVSGVRETQAVVDDLRAQFRKRASEQPRGPGGRFIKTGGEEGEEPPTTGVPVPTPKPPKGPKISLAEQRSQEFRERLAQGRMTEEEAAEAHRKFAARMTFRKRGEEVTAGAAPASVPVQDLSQGGVVRGAPSARIPMAQEQIGPRRPVVEVPPAGSRRGFAEPPISSSVDWSTLNAPKALPLSESLPSKFSASVSEQLEALGIDPDTDLSSLPASVLSTLNLSQADLANINREKQRKLRLGKAMGFAEGGQVPSTRRSATIDVGAGTAATTGATSKAGRAVVDTGVTLYRGLREPMQLFDEEKQAEYIALKNAYREWIDAGKRGEDFPYATWLAKLRKIGSKQYFSTFQKEAMEYAGPGGHLSSIRVPSDIATSGIASLLRDTYAFSAEELHDLVKEYGVKSIRLPPKAAQHKADGGLVQYGGEDYFDTPRIRALIEKAKEIEEGLPEVQKGYTRLWRGNRVGEVGQNPSYTNSLVGIAIPFLNAYGGPLSYVDVPTSELGNYENKICTSQGNEFMLPASILSNYKVVKGYAKGGPVGTDTVPAWLTPGEVVVPESMVRSGAVDHLRGRLPGFEKGGRVGRTVYMASGGFLGGLQSALNVVQAATSMGVLEEYTPGTLYIPSRPAPGGMGPPTPAVAGIPAEGSALAGTAAAAAPYVAIAMAIQQAVTGAIKGIGEFAAGIAAPGKSAGATLEQFGKGLENVNPVVGAIAQSLGAFMQGVDKAAEHYGQYSPEIAQARGLAEVAQVTGDLRRAAESGKELARFTEIQSSMQQKFEDIKVKLLTKILEVLNPILNIMDKGMNTDAIVTAIQGLTIVFGPWVGIAQGISAIARVLEDQTRQEQPNDPTDYILHHVGGQEPPVSALP